MRVTILEKDELNANWKDCGLVRDIGARNLLTKGVEAQPVFDATGVTGGGASRNSSVGVNLDVWDVYLLFLDVALIEEIVLAPLPVH